MKTYIVKDYDEMSKKAASILAAQIVADPESVLGLATGSTPVGTYRYLRKWHEEGVLDFSGICTMNLDEYRGISKENSQSYYHFMVENLFSHVNIKRENTYIPDGTRKDSGAVCREYEDLIQRKGGIDLQLLGIGRNGHIGFNEPSDCFTEKSHCVSLARSTMEANKRFFEKAEDVPKEAYTMGIGTIMSAEKILLLVCGSDKAEAMYQTICGPITPEVPATVLRLHKNVIMIADEAAMSKVKSE
ncbi:glucosamine-6-phosphate deaminase [Extibacter muris]|uniref:glucosamine-6-phosphate deaminase n=1 Tax=Extibacter muris TaxID=1796622 RepID=UPI001D07E7A2|nr:glucosamine-6-phosphate deaminase [Extibacter muris]MCB6200874.1 glucosamine-6-phosphate deaminase [Extibacter muris]MCQ4662204.1 glucosamine-6-phosphate deaminase [Extibacter muris]MCQ4691882.1 glucosamine-6-phosphate deaminase [Extibacter muris]